MQELTVSDVVELNQTVLNPGEPFRILDLGRLESALGNQYAPYELDEQVIASVFRSLILNHPFANGNKRTASMVLKVLANSIKKDIVLSRDELGDLVYQIASEGGSQMPVNTIANKLFGLDLDESLVEARAQSAVKSNGIFSVLKNEWIKEPVAADIPEVNERALKKELSKWVKRYNDIVRGQDILNVEIEEPVLEAVATKGLYRYEGPVYRFGRLFRDRVELETRAVSLKQAINNFLYKAADAIGYKRDKRASVDIDRDSVYEVEPEWDYEQERDVTNILCPVCGKHYLNDSGECPLCDLNDDSVLEESVETDKIEEIEDFIEDVYDLRKTSIAEEGEYGIGNLVFKELRNMGVLDSLRELKLKLKDKHLSLEGLDEHLTKTDLRKKVPEITEDTVRGWINDERGWDMTIDPDTLERADFENIPDGWIVTQNLGLDNIFDKSDYAGMTEFIKDILLEYGDKYYIGTYKMKYGKHRGMIAIDVNKIIDDTAEAIEDSLENKQESIYKFDEYIYFVHNLISRKTGKKKPYPFTREELKDYGLDKHIIRYPRENCLNIELINGVYNTDIPAHSPNK